MRKKTLFALAFALLLAGLVGKPTRADIPPISPLNPQIPKVNPIDNSQTTTGVVVVAVSLISLGALIFIRKI
jgi:hypothetical protein